MREKTPRGALLLLGMHRSGTSALTRGLEVLGIDIGRDLKPAVPGENDKGFFEDWTLSTINDELLALANEHWDSLLATTPTTLPIERVNELKLKALDYLRRTFADAAYFAFKDPRSCRHVWFWDDVIRRDDRAPFHLIAFRNPVSVAHSLQARNGFPSKKSLYLWLVHYLRALDHTIDKPRAFVDFDDLLADPDGVLERIAATIDHPEVKLSPAKLAVYKSSFLDRTLRRHAFRPETVDLDAGCSPLVVDVYRLLQRGAKEATDLRDEWRTLIAAFNSVAPHLDLLQDLEREKSGAVWDGARLRESLAGAQQLVEQREQAMQQALARIADLEREAAERAVAHAAEIENTARQSQANTEMLLAAATEEHQLEIERQKAEAREALHSAIARERRQYADLLAEALDVERKAADEARAMALIDYDASLALERERAREALSAERERSRLEMDRAVSDALRAQLAELESAAERAVAEAVRAEREAVELEAEQAFAESREADRIALEQAAEAAIAEALATEREVAAARMSALKELHERAEQQSDAKDAVLQGERARVAHLEQRLLHLDAQRSQLSETVGALRTSTSWRITAPLRAVKNFFAPTRTGATPYAPSSAAAPTAAPSDLPPMTPAAATRPQSGKRVHFTICAKNYLPIARTCLETSAKHHPDAEHVLVLCDEADQGYDPQCEPFRVILAREIGIEHFADMAFRYDVMELSTAIKPFCVSHFFEHGIDEVIYLDPDLYFLSPLHSIRDAFDAGAEAVVTPHINAPIWDDKRPSDHDMLRVGVFNLGFLALRRSAASIEFVRWWGQRLRMGAVSDPARGLFTDQKWCDLLPCFVPKTSVLHRPGYNLAYWNLMHRPVRCEGGVWMAGGEPICFVHFSGASFSDGKVFSKHQDRYDVSDIGALRDLYDAYRDEVRGHGFGEGPSYRYAYDFDGAGRGIAPILRQMYREDLAPTGQHEYPDYDRVLAYANEPAPGVNRRRDVFISRLLHRIWKARVDLQAAFDLNTDAGQRDFIGWAMTALPREYGLDAGAYPLVDGERGARLALHNAPAPDPVSEISKAVLSHSASLRPLYRHLPASWRQRAKVALTRTAFARRGAGVSGVAPEPGAALIGYARGELGMGEHVRMTAAALQAESVPFGIVNISENVLARQEDRRFDQFHDERADFRANLFHVNADQLPVVTARLGDHFLQRKLNIGYPAWELATFPDEWAVQLNGMEEIWAPSLFIKEALAAKVRRPVVHMPLGVELAEGFERWTRRDFGLPEGTFVLLFHFDLASYSSRKNPQATIDAFRRAFDGQKGLPAFLVMKTLSSERFGGAFRELSALVEADPRMKIIADTLSADQMHGLVNCADAFVSLHRSEGFGRGPAEAMRLGKPVVATGYSGNMDYMSDDNSFLVPYSMKPLSEGDYPFWRGQYWAEPDIDVAAEMLRSLVKDPRLAEAKGRRAALDMEQRHSRYAIGARYAARLRELGAY